MGRLSHTGRDETPGIERYGGRYCQGCYEDELIHTCVTRQGPRSGDTYDSLPICMNVCARIDVCVCINFSTQV